MNSIEGLLGDTNYSDKMMNMETLSFSNLEYALEKCGVYFEHINFDCCLLSSIEMLSHLYGYTNYVTFSQNEIPGLGQAYNTFFPYLYSNSGIDGKEFGQKLVEFYALRYPDGDKDGDVRSFVTVDVNKTPSLIKAFNDFYYEYAKELYEPSKYRQILNLHKSENIFAYAKNMVDIIQYVNKVKKLGLCSSKADILSDTIKNMITSKTNGVSTSTCGGISHCLWIDEMYQNSVHDYDIYTMQDQKLYGYIAFLDLFNPGWHAPMEIYEKNNIEKYQELPFDKFYLRMSYLNSDREIDGVKITSGLPVLDKINFKGIINSKIIKDIGFAKITQQVRYDSGNMFSLAQNENIFTTIKDNLEWVSFTPYHNEIDEEYKNLTYPLMLNDITSRITDLGNNSNIFLAEKFNVENLGDVYFIVSKQNDNYEIKDYITFDDYSSLYGDITLESLKRKSFSISSLTNKKITYIVKDAFTENTFTEIFTYENFDGSEQNLKKIFVKSNIKTMFSYMYEAYDILGRKQELLLR